jgi:hypothetical protein
MSIALATPFSISGPSTTSETDAFAAATRYDIDTVGQTITIWLPCGSAVTSGGKTTSFAPGPQAPTLTVEFSLGSSTWSASNGQSGTLTADQIATVQAMLAGVNAAVRNQAEASVQSMGILAGTNVPW